MELLLFSTQGLVFKTGSRLLFLRQPHVAWGRSSQGMCIMSVQTNQYVSNMFHQLNFKFTYSRLT